MKRSLVLSICAAALAACFTHNAMATVDVQLRLRYTDPNNDAAGGTWDLLVQSDAANGIAGLQFILGDVDTGTISANASVFNDTTSVFLTDPQGANVEIVAGDDLAGTLVTGVGTLGGPGDDGADTLLGGNSIWDNSSLIASGTFSTATRPSILAVNANEFDGTNTPILATIGDTSVRGDNVNDDGIIIGDLDRGGDVDLFGDVLGALANVGTGTIWDEGDFDSSGDVDLFGDVLGALANVGQAATPPAVSALTAVPEPTSIALASLMFVAVVGTRRRA